MESSHPLNSEFNTTNYTNIYETTNSSEGGFLAGASDWVTKGVPLAVGSGIAGLWNGVGTLGNGAARFLSGNDNANPFGEELEATFWLNNFDDPSSYQSYYQDHQEGIDLGGFMLSSIVPSSLAIKGLRAAQAGFAVTKASSAVTGLLTNTAERYWLNKAAITLANGTSPLVPRLAAAGSKGVQLGFEAMVGEAANFAVQYQNPFYEDVQDIGDFVSHELMLGGALGVLGAGFGTWFYKGTKFDLENAQGFSTGVRTNIKEVEGLIGQAAQDAAFTSFPKQMAGRSLDNPLFSSQAKAAQDLYGMLPEAGVHFTAGEDVALAYSSLRKQAVRTAKDLGEFDGTPLADAIKTRVGGLANKLTEEQEKLMHQLYGALDDGSGMAALARKSLEASGESAVREGLVGATKIGRATLKDLDAPNKVLLDLATGKIDSRAVLTAGDIGVVNFVNPSLANVGEETWKLGAKTKEELRQLPTEVAHLKFDAEFTALSKAKDPIIKAIDSWDLAKLEAHYRKYGKLYVKEQADSTLSIMAKEDIRAQLEKDITGTPLPPKSRAYTGEGEVTKKFYSGQDALNFIKAEKTSQYMQLTSSGMSDVEARTRLNISPEFLNSSNPPESAIVGAISSTETRHVSITQLLDKTMFNHFRTQAAVNLEAKHRIFQEANEAIAGLLTKGEMNYPVIDLSLHDGVNKASGWITASNSKYNSEFSKMELVGSMNQRLQVKLANDRTANFLNVDQALLRTGNGSAEFTELASIMTKITGEEVPYYLKGNRLVAEGMDELAITSPLVQKHIEVYLAEDANRIANKNLSRIAQGKKPIVADGRLYYPPPHPSELAFKAMVRDEKGNVGMLWDKTEAGLAEKMRLVGEAKKDWVIRTPKQQDAYHQLLGVYDDDLSLRGKLSVDSSLKSLGIMSNLTPSTNGNELLGLIHSGFARAERQTITDATFLQYGQQLAEARMAQEVLGVADGGMKKVFNTLLNIEDKDNGWHQFSTLIESKLDWAGGKAMRAAAEVLTGKKAISQLEAETIAAEKGTSLFTSDALWNLSKANSFSGGTQKLMRETNALIRYMVLGVDYFNGLVNIIGQPILLLPEIRAAMQAGSDIPYMKLVGNAIKTSLNKESAADLINRYEKYGIVNKDVLAHHELIDTHALMMGAQTSEEAARLVGQTQGKAKTFLNTLQKPTAYAERFTQLIATSVGEQVGVSRGLQGADLAAFVTTFAKKVNGNYVSAQRPLLFQGVLGQAVGLFQTYQFNLFQQAARHFSEGNKKGVAAMAALQGSIFGAQSLPGFELANRALLGQWNDERNDAFTMAKTGVSLAGLNTSGEDGALQDRDLGDWLLYGGASSLLGANLWTRGDANPRNITGIPVNPADLAQVSYFAKGLKGFGELTSSILAGGNIKVSALEAIAHANLSRPLSGAAELAMGARTTTGGTLETALNSDLLSWSAAVRLLGAKPMQEAIAASETYKMGIVKAEEQKHLNEVGYALRSAVLGEGELDAEAIDKFSQKYIEAGGNPRGFRKWYLANLAKATTPRAQLFAEKMKSNPWAQRYQEVVQPEGMESFDTTSQEQDGTVSP